jgi:hypothetical protein
MTTDFALDRARTMRHTCEMIRVWIRVLIFMELKVEDGGFLEKT